MTAYKLTPQAKEDLYRIYAHGVTAFGEDRADRYFAAFFERFEQIAAQPRLYPAVDHIREGYRRSVCGVDSIYYRLDDSGSVEIMTIIGRQDESIIFDDVFL